MAIRNLMCTCAPLEACAQAADEANADRRACAASPARRSRGGAEETTLLIGLDISDGRNYDTARTADLTPALALGGVNETLFTLAPDDLVMLKLLLATSWALTPDGKAWRSSCVPA